MEEIKGMLKAILEAQQATNAKLESMEKDLKDLKRNQQDIQENIRILVPMK